MPQPMWINKSIKTTLLILNQIYTQPMLVALHGEDKLTDETRIPKLSRRNYKFAHSDTLELLQEESCNKKATSDDVLWKEEFMK